MSIKVALLALLIAISISLPYDDQLTLASSLIVGRDGYEELIAWNCKVCDSSNKPLHAHIIEEKEKDIKCIITVYKDLIILAFRYTNTALNVWQDILYPLQINQDGTCDKCKVQKAYYNMWNNIKAEVIGDLKEMSLQTKISTLHITGISLGGGLSVISYIDIAASKIFPTITVTTYGAPRVGNKEWAAKFDSLTGTKSRRYVVNGDTVAGMPTCLTLLCSYKQTGIKLTCYEDQAKCVREAEVNSTLSDIKGIMKAGYKVLQTRDLNSIVDHVDGYPKIYNFTLVM